MTIEKINDLIALGLSGCLLGQIIKIYQLDGRQAVIDVLDATQLDGWVYSKARILEIL